MSDRVQIQVQFKKFIWTCPACGQEDIEDAKVGGGNVYEHACSSCSTFFNQSSPNMREYNGTVNYTEQEYAKKLESDIATDKAALCANWLNGVKNPPPYVAPSVEDYQTMVSEKLSEIERLSADMAKIATVSELTAVKDSLEQKTASLAASISEKELVAEQVIEVKK